MTIGHTGLKSLAVTLAAALTLAACAGASEDDDGAQATQSNPSDSQAAAAQTVASMNSSVDDHEQAIAAIDSYRRQFNTRLVDIEQRLDALGSAPLL